jgi:uncharacterized protein
MPASSLKSSRYNATVALSSGTTLLFNFVTLRLVALDVRDAAKADRILADPVLPSRKGEARLTDLFVENGFLVPQNVDEAARLEREYRQSMDAEPVLSLTILPTLACNLGCSYCYEGRPGPEHMSGAVEAALITFVRERLTHGSRGMSVIWYGGEPLLRKETIGTLSREFLQLCEARQADYEAAIITNGYLLDQATAAWLKGLGVKTAQITLDGPADIHDARRPLATGGRTFRTILANITAAADVLDIGVRVNVDVRNRDAVARLLDVLVAEGVAEKVTIYPAMTESYGPGCGCGDQHRLGRERFSLLSLEASLELTRRGLSDPQRPEARFLPCGAVRRASAIVTPSGGLAACWARVSWPDRYIGHVLSPMTAAIEDERRLWFGFDPFQLECRDCKVLPICMGACPHLHFERGLLDCPAWKHHPEEHILNFYRRQVRNQQQQVVAGMNAVVEALKKHPSAEQCGVDLPPAQV